jgi:hypothetical protein
MTTPSGTPEERANEVSNDILRGWSLPGMSVGHQIKNGCLEGDLRFKIAAALKDYAEKAIADSNKQSAYCEMVRKIGFEEGFSDAIEKAAKEADKRAETWSVTMAALAEEIAKAIRSLRSGKETR